ncbi:dihydrofolate reductase family protein [Streptomyces sp. BI20]|uniref:dihydrofolate reductase family protein n=1 Tax=Streptomyces sp. BI20 TaxID=3403460 RepID=UPI003C75DFDE
MARVVMMLSVSLDGYMAGPNGEIDWHMVDEETHDRINARLAACSAFLMGRVSQDMMEEYWPTADADPDADRVTVEFAEIWREKPKHVYSRTRPPGPGPWNSTWRSRVDPAEVRALKARSEGDLAIGGAELAGEFLRLGLLDACLLYVNPILLGGGKPLFPALTGRIPLRTSPAVTLGNGVVELHHEILHPDTPATRHP